MCMYMGRRIATTAYHYIFLLLAHLAHASWFTFCERDVLCVLGEFIWHIKDCLFLLLFLGGPWSNALYSSLLCLFCEQKWWVVEKEVHPVSLSYGVISLRAIVIHIKYIPYPFFQPLPILPSYSFSSIYLSISLSLSSPSPPPLYFSYSSPSLSPSHPLFFSFIWLLCACLFVLSVPCLLFCYFFQFIGLFCCLLL